MRNTSCFFRFALFLFLIISNSSGFAQGWKPLGSPTGMIAGGSNYGHTIAVDTSGVPHIAYTDFLDSSKIVVRKLVNGTWANMTTPNSNIKGIYPFLVFSKKDTAYLSYTTFEDSTKAKVFKYDGLNWVEVGNPMVFSGNIFLTSLAIDASDNLYFGAANGKLAGQMVGTAAAIMRFDGSDWVPFPNSDFVKFTTRLNLRIGANDQLLVGYNNHYHGTNLSVVQKFNGTSWDTLGQSFDGIYNLETGQDGTPYILRKQWGAYAVVDKLINNSWTAIGGPVQLTLYDQVSMFALDTDDNPYLAYTELNGLYRVSVKKFDGSSWIQLDTNSFSPSSAYLPILAVGKKVPYLVYRTYASNSEIYTMYYDSPNTVSSLPKKSSGFSVFPNPISSQQFFIELETVKSGPYHVKLTNGMGQIMQAGYYSFGANQKLMGLDIQKRLSDGIYYLELINGRDRYSSKVIVSGMK